MHQNLPTCVWIINHNNENGACNKESDEDTYNVSSGTGILIYLEMFADLTLECLAMALWNKGFVRLSEQDTKTGILTRWKFMTCQYIVSHWNTMHCKYKIGISTQIAKIIYHLISGPMPQISHAIDARADGTTPRALLNNSQYICKMIIGFDKYFRRIIVLHVSSCIVKCATIWYPNCSLSRYPLERNHYWDNPTVSTFKTPSGPNSHANGHVARANAWASETGQGTKHICNCPMGHWCPWDNQHAVGTVQTPDAVGTTPRHNVQSKESWTNHRLCCTVLKESIVRSRILRRRLRSRF